MNRFYSFDVFDTCLCRTCGEPRNVFALLAKKILGLNEPLSVYMDFIYIRIQGELKARKETKMEDVNIQEIYEKCDFSALTSTPNSFILEKEIEIEENVLLPILKTKEFIDKLHDDGFFVSFISDMYLSSSFILRILKRYGFYKEGDYVYVSGEIGLTKSSGSLYKHISSLHGISNRNWYHYGDNFFSDFLIPRKHGIKGHRWKYNYTLYQKYFLKNDCEITNNSLRISAGVSKSIMLEGGEDIYKQFASDLIAPLYVTFVFHVLNDALRRGIRRLYFLSRDGYIFYEIAKILSPSYPDLELHYLCASRKSLYFPCLEELSEETVKRAIEGKTQREILNYLDGIHIDINRLGLSPDTINDISKLEKILNSSIKKVNHEIQKQKLLAADYFIQEGLADKDVRTAVVDLRGTRKCQEMINKILAWTGYPPCYAYYMEATNQRILPDNISKYDAMLFDDFLEGKKTYKYFSYTEFMLEHYFSITSFPRTSSYKRLGDGTVGVNYDVNLNDNFSDSIMKTNVEICSLYAKRLDFLKDIVNTEVIFQKSIKLITDFAHSPNRKYLKALVGVETSESQLTPSYLIDKVTLGHILRKDLTWFDGAVMLSFGKIPFVLFSFIFRRCIPIIRNILC